MKWDVYSGFAYVHTTLTPRPKMKVLLHDIAEARKKAGTQLPILQYSDGTRHVLLPSGQRINLDKKRVPGVSGKRQRHDRIKATRLARLALVA